MISRYFGLPGCGKTTTLAMLALGAVTSGKYKYVYSNVHLEIPGVIYIPFDVLGRYEVRECCILIDEATVYIGDRDFKDLPKKRLEYFVEHRHHFCDIILFSQDPDGVDKKVRHLTESMYYVKKGIFLGKWITNIYRIPYGIVWPDENSNGENLGKIVMGYMKPPFLSKLFARRILRSKYYKYFDSWEAQQLDPLPDIYKPYPGIITRKTGPILYLHKTLILLRLVKPYRKWKRRMQVKARREKKHSLPDNAPGKPKSLASTFLTL